MSFSFTTWFETTEADVVSMISKVAADVQLVESELSRGLAWVAGEVPTIVTGLQTAVGLAQQVGVVSAPELAAANAAVTALNAFAGSVNSGTTNAQALVNGYVAYKSASAAVATAAASAAAAAPAAAAGVAKVTTAAVTTPAA